MTPQRTREAMDTPTGRQRTVSSAASPYDLRQRDASLAPSSSMTIKETSYGSTDSLAYKRLVWFHDATGRDGELIRKVIERNERPQSEAERRCLLALPRIQNNIWRLLEAAKASQADRQQVCRYHPGVGCGQRMWNEVLPLATAWDWARRLKGSYLAMSEDYAWGDEIVLVRACLLESWAGASSSPWQIGFSRGAYLSRAFALILDRLGMVPATFLVDTVGTRGIDLLSVALDAYVNLFRGRRLSASRANLDRVAATLKGVRQGRPGTSRNGGTIVHSLGLYDTVCAFGWPKCFGGKGGSYVWQRMFGDECPDERCPPNVEYAYHAVSLAENRVDYTLRRIVRNDCAGSHNIDVRETYFHGGHSDIGGGQLQHDISDITLCHLAALLNSSTPSLLAPSVFSQLHRDHLTPWGRSLPQLYSYSFTDGGEFVTLFRRGPREFVHPLKTNDDAPLVLHASVPAAVRASLQIATRVAPLLPEEETLRRTWALQTVDRSASVDGRALSTRDVLTCTLKLARQSC